MTPPGRMRETSMDDIAASVAQRSVATVPGMTPAVPEPSPKTTLVSTTALTLSDEQLTILRAIASGKRNIQVKARAGTGKTTLIMQALAVVSGQVAIQVFGNKICAEITEKVARSPYRATVDTFHRTGLQALKAMLPKDGKGRTRFKIEDRKTLIMLDKLQVPAGLRSMVGKMISLAMQRGFGIAGLTSAQDLDKWLDLISHYELDSDLNPEDVLIQLHGRDVVIKTAIRHAIMGLRLTRDLALGKDPDYPNGIINFDDMLYLPLLLNATFKQYDWVMTDEAQDSNPVRREIAIRITKPTGHRLWVGDEFQSIFGFTGADIDAMDIIAKIDDCLVLPMTMTFRCGQIIARMAAEIVPDFRAAPGNPEGRYDQIDVAEFDKWDLVPGQDVILCRNTKPLVEVAYGLLKHGIPCYLEGREFTTKLYSLLDRFPHLKTLPALQSKLEEHRDREVARLEKAGKDRSAEEVKDQVETLLVLARNQPPGATVADLRASIDALFIDLKTGEKRAAVLLMTSHRSKGLEFRRVFIWGRKKFMPARGARQDWQMRQEYNLEYVTLTRAIEWLVDVIVA